MLFYLTSCLATGASAIKAIEAVKQQGVSSVKLITALSCPEGVRAVHDQHPDVDIYTVQWMKA